MNIFVLGVLLIIATVSAFFLPRETRTEITKTMQTEIPNPHAAYQTDTDGDGMPDWEETLRGTDPTKPDQPNAAQPEIIARLQEKRAELPVASYFIAPSAPVAPTQTTTLPEVPSTETAALHAFGNALGAALQPIANESFEHESLALLNAAIASPAAQKELATTAATYGAVVSALNGITATGQAEALSAKVATAYARLAEALAVLARAPTEPQEVSNVWLAYSDAALEVGKALNETIGFFAMRKISFAPTEPGALFNAN